MGIGVPSQGWAVSCHHTADCVVFDSAAASGKVKEG
jgi:hypothetical protein